MVGKKDYDGALTITAIGRKNLSAMNGDFERAKQDLAKIPVPEKLQF